MASSRTAVDGAEWSLGGLLEQANPTFAGAAVVVPLGALAVALARPEIHWLLYVHVMAGVLWTGIDVFMGAVLGPVLGRLDVDRRASFFAAFTPKMTFLMPALATVTIVGGILLARQVTVFEHASFWMALMGAGTMVPVVVLIGFQFDALGDPRVLGVLALVTLLSVGGIVLTLPDAGMTDAWIAAAIAIVTLLSIVGFGVILPGEVRIYRQISSTDPDTALIADIGMRNAKLGGLQGALQLSIIFVMVNIRL